MKLNFKKFTILTIVLTFSIIVFAGDKDTLKEKIQKNGPVKVFFNLKDEIIDEEDERKLQLVDPSKHTTIRTQTPKAFASAETRTKVIKMLNEGLQVSDFVEGDIESLPKTNDKKHGYRDLSKLPDGFYAMIYIRGEYIRFLDKKEVEGKTVFSSSNRMGIKSHLFFYEVTSGKVKSYGANMGTLLGHANAAPTNTTQLENIEYMEANFQALPLLDEFKRIMYEYLGDFTKRKLKKHNKVIAKRNK